MEHPNCYRFRMYGIRFFCVKGERPDHMEGQSFKLINPKHCVNCSYKKSFESFQPNDTCFELINQIFFRDQVKLLEKAGPGQWKCVDLNTGEIRKINTLDLYWIKSEPKLEAVKDEKVADDYPQTFKPGDPISSFIAEKNLGYSGMIEKAFEGDYYDWWIKPPNFKEGSCRLIPRKEDQLRHYLSQLHQTDISEQLAEEVQEVLKCNCDLTCQWYRHSRSSKYPDGACIREYEQSKTQKPSKNHCIHYTKRGLVNPGDKIRGLIITGEGFFIYEGFVTGPEQTFSNSKVYRCEVVRANSDSLNPFIWGCRFEESQIWKISKLSNRVKGAFKEREEKDRQVKSQALKPKKIDTWTVKGMDHVALKNLQKKQKEQKKPRPRVKFDPGETMNSFF